MNNTAKATEIKFNLPIVNVTIPIVMDKPIKIEPTKIKIIFKSLKAIHRRIETISILKIPAIIFPVDTEPISS